MAPGLEDEQAADAVETRESVSALVEDRGSTRAFRAAGDDPKWLAAGVVVDGLDPHPVDPAGC